MHIDAGQSHRDVVVDQLVVEVPGHSALDFALQLI